MATLPIEQFLEEKIKEYNSNFDLRSGTAFRDLFIKPSSIILQPFRDELDTVELNQSILNVLSAVDPNAADEQAVDALVSNLFITRKAGGKTQGVVRAQFFDPRQIEITVGTEVFYDSAGNKFLNTVAISQTPAQMGLNLENGYYYVDIPVEAENPGAIAVLADSIVAWEGAPSDLANVTNPADFTIGADRETNIELINRAKNSIAVRDLVTRKGIYATLFETFNTIEELQVIGFGDPEQQRDIVYNTHVGGHVDIHIKTPLLYSSYKDFTGILTDTTRRKHQKTNVILTGTASVGLGAPSIDRTDYVPHVSQIASQTVASYTSTVDLAGGIDLSTLYNIKIEYTESGSAPIVYQIGLAGIIPLTTTRSEIINKINAAFGKVLAVAYDSGGSQFIKFATKTYGAQARIRFLAPTSADCSYLAFGINEALYPVEFPGTDPTVYVENIDYTLDDVDGSLTRIASGNIADGELVHVEYEYNPLSLDIGKPVRNNDGTYSVREGRVNYTITDNPVMYVESIEILDPVSGESTGEKLDAIGGYGHGSFGRGGFGVGSGADYRMVVVNPHTRFSPLEEGYIELHPRYIGMDLRVTYKYAKEIQEIYDFVISEQEKIVAADLLVKHFIPILVDLEINYDVKQSQVNTIKTNAELVDYLGEAINDSPSGKPIEMSDIIDLLYNQGAVYCQLPFTMHGEIHNVDGTVQKIQNSNVLAAPSPILESDTRRPISPRTTHFIPRNVVLNRRVIVG